jgi:hypothetical protein
MKKTEVDQAKKTGADFVRVLCHVTVDAVIGDVQFATQIPRHIAVLETAAPNNTTHNN